MDDSDAFERQVAGEMMRRAGPTLTVDDAAIWTAIIATSAPKPSFEAIFGAVRLVVAGVIVGAFGGLLLTVVLTPATRPGYGARGRVAPHRAHRHRQFCPCRRLTLLRFRRPQLRRRQSARLRPVSRPPSSSGPSSTRSRMACHRVRRLKTLRSSHSSSETSTGGKCHRASSARCR